jgi:hypothetical protein
MTPAANTRAPWIVLGIIFALGIYCVCPFRIPPVDALFYLAIGWIPFIVRTAPQTTIDWPSVAIGAVALALFVGGLHAFLNSFRRREPVEVLFIDGSGSATDSAQAATSFPRTLRIAGVVLAMFTAGICTIGAVHQTIWLFASHEPFFARYKEERRRAESGYQLKSLGIGLHNYQDAYSLLPPGGTRDEKGRMLHGWHTSLLPYIEQRPLFEQIDLEEPWNSPRNREWMEHGIPSLLVIHGSGPPVRTNDEEGFAVSHYSGNVLVLGGHAPRRTTQFADGAANTLLCGEATHSPKAWGSPTHWRDPRLGIDQTAETFGGPWKRTPGATFVLADGSTRFIDANIDPQVLAALATPDGGD